ncbi:copper resistance protein CopC [Planomicrobium okeanokoites]|uniref:copper resistance protein CopC n=1 Tax=Planomicrobium okeanokoites TaxID=244 RepID=UPI0035669BAA
MEETNPSEGERLTESPSTLEFWFQDPIVLHAESIQLKSPSRNGIELEDTRVDPDDKTHIISNLNEELPPGNYTVRISVIALDGDILEEKLNFEVVAQEKAQQQTSLEILRNYPEDGEITEGSPQKIDLWFNQPADITAIGVFDDRQQSISIKEPVMDPEDPNHVIVEFNEELPKGSYQVTWYARPEASENLSLPDTIDVFYFAVDEFTAIQQPNEGEPVGSAWFASMGLKQTGYWFFFIGIMALFGLAFFHTVIHKEAASLKRNPLSFFLLFFVFTGVLLVLVAQKSELDSLSFTQFLSLKFVWIPLVQIGLLLLGVFLTKARLLFFAAALLLIPFITGHAAYPRYGGYFSMFMNALHLLAASIWIGGLLAMLTFSKKEEMKKFLRSTLPAFSNWAFISLAVIIVTGLYMTMKYVPSYTIESFWGSEWGKAIVLKMALTLAVLVIGFFQRRLIKRLTEKAVSKVLNRLRVEIIYAALLLLFASVLVVSTPGSAEQGVYPATIEKEDIELDVSFSPLKLGLNVLTMDFEGEPIEDVEVMLSMPPNYQVNYKAFQVEEGVFKLTGNLLHAAGTMNMTVTAKKPDGEKVEFDFRVVIPGEMRFNE